MYDYSEMNKLQAALEKEGFKVEVRSVLDGKQLWVDDGAWDVVINEMSYGHALGLMEVMGLSFPKWMQVEDTVLGYLTSDMVLALVLYDLTGDDSECRKYWQDIA